MNRGRILMHVQHLLGVGHVKRAAAIARAMSGAGLEVVVAQGGFDDTGADFGAAEIVRLPPARSADAAFTAIVDDTDTPISDAWKQTRAAALRRAFDAARPDALMIELYPFGRRAFAFELDPLLEHVHAMRRRPAVVCSLRDILVKKTKPGRDENVVRTVERWFDKVLVHGDPAFVPLDETFSKTDQLAGKIIYTGLVREAGRSPQQYDGPRINEVVISGGGGAVAAPLFRAALDALADTPARTWTWRFLCGPNLTDEAVAALRASAPENAKFEPNRPDFGAVLRRAGLSISQAGYNTAMDVLDSGIPAVLVPFADGEESEQTLRAERLAAIGACTWTPGQPINPNDLSAAVHRALGAEMQDLRGPELDTSGAETTARIMTSLLDS